MSVGIYMDVNVRAEITRELRVRGVDVLTSQEDGTRESSDSALLDRATKLSRVFFTRDEDLLAEAAVRQRSGITFGGLIYAHQLGATIGQCIRDLAMLTKTSDASEWANRVEYLPLK